MVGLDEVDMRYLSIVKAWPVMLLLGLMFLMPSPSAEGDTSSTNVYISAYPSICELPTDIAFTYLAKDKLNISWQNGAGAVNTMIRASYTGVPTSTDDGYLIYYGDDNAIVDNIVAFDFSNTVYYSFWAQRADGLWAGVPVEIAVDAPETIEVWQILLVLGLIFVAFWRAWGWLYLVDGLGVLILALKIAAVDQVYGLPLIFVSIMMIFLGIFRIRSTGV